MASDQIVSESVLSAMPSQFTAVYLRRFQSITIPRRNDYLWFT